MTFVDPFVVASGDPFVVASAGPFVVASGDPFVVASVDPFVVASGDHMQPEDGTDEVDSQDRLHWLGVVAADREEVVLLHSIHCCCND